MFNGAYNMRFEGVNLNNVAGNQYNSKPKFYGKYVNNDNRRQERNDNRHMNNTNNTTNNNYGVASFSPHADINLKYDSGSSKNGEFVQNPAFEYGRTNTAIPAYISPRPADPLSRPSSSSSHIPSRNSRRLHGKPYYHSVHDSYDRNDSDSDDSDYDSEGIAIPSSVQRKRKRHFDNLPTEIWREFTPSCSNNPHTEANHGRLYPGGSSWSKNRSGYGAEQQTNGYPPTETQSQSPNNLGRQSFSRAYPQHQGPGPYFQQGQYFNPGMDDRAYGQSQPSSNTSGQFRDSYHPQANFGPGDNRLYGQMVNEQMHRIHSPNPFTQNQHYSGEQGAQMLHPSPPSSSQAPASNPTASSITTSIPSPIILSNSGMVRIRVEPVSADEDLTDSLNEHEDSTVSSALPTSTENSLAGSKHGKESRTRILDLLKLFGTFSSSKKEKN